MKTAYVVFFIVEHDGCSVEAICATHEIAEKFILDGIEEDRWGHYKWRRCDEDIWMVKDLELSISKRQVLE